METWLERKVYNTGHFIADDKGEIPKFVAIGNNEHNQIENYENFGSFTKFKGINPKKNWANNNVKVSESFHCQQRIALTKQSFQELLRSLVFCRFTNEKSDSTDAVSRQKQDYQRKFLSFFYLSE